MVQRTSSDLRLNPHLHVVVLDGVWHEQDGELVWQGLGHLKAVGAAVTNQARSGTDQIAALPTPVVAFLERERTRFDAIETQMLEGGAIVWEEDLSKGWAAPTPGLLGIRQLEGVLLGRALIALRDGHEQSALRSLEASWRLTTAMMTRVDFLSSLIAMATSHMHYGVLRCLTSPQGIWQQRLESQDFPDAALRAYQSDGHSHQSIASEFVGWFDTQSFDSETRRPKGPAAFLGRLVTAPYLRASLYDTSARLSGISHRLKESNACRVDINALATEVGDSFPRWNSIGKNATPSLVRAWSFVRDITLDRELTLAVMQGRTTAPTSIPSAFCEGFTWVQSAHGAGFTTSLDPPLPHKLSDSAFKPTFRASSVGKVN